MRGRPKIALVLAAVLLAACSRNDGRTLTPPRPDQTLSIATTTTVADTVGPSVDGSGDGAVDGSDDGAEGTGPTLLAPWVAGEPIPDTYTCKGANLAPSLVWRGMQPGAVEQALVMTDPSANTFVHWLVAGIPPLVTNLDPANLPSGVIVGMNTEGATGYAAPCPTDGPQTYFLTLYSLGTASGITTATPAATALDIITTSQTESVTVSGTSDP